MANGRTSDQIDREAAFAAIAEILPVIVWSAEPDGTVDFISRDFYDLTGLEDLDLAADAWLEGLHPDDHERTLATWRHIVEHGIEYDIEFRLRTPKGDCRWHLVQARPERDDEGRILRWLGTAFDIHERKQAQQVQRLETDVLDRISAGEALPSVLDTISLGIERLLPKALVSILLVEGGQLRHGSAPSLPPEYNRAIDGMAIGENSGSCGTAAWSRETVSARDIASDPRWVDYRDLASAHGLAACWSVPVLNSDGNVLATFALYGREPGSLSDRDQTLVQRVGPFVGLAIERVRAAEKLREQKERLSLVVQAASDVIWDWDLTTDRIWWNEGLESQFGYRHDDLPADSSALRQLTHPDDYERVKHSMETCMRSSRLEWMDEYRVLCQDGSERWVENCALLIKDPSGRTVRMVGSINDITAMRELQNQLRQSQRLEAIGQLTGGVAHDFNNLLTVILGNSELLTLKLAEDEKLRPLAEMTHTAAIQGSELTNRLLAFARKQALDPKPVDINRLVGGMDPFLRHTLSEDIEIEIVLGGGLWPAMVDASQLESALLNLSINARDAMPEGGRLTIETANAKLDDAYAAEAVDVTPGQYVMIAISDSGTGIEPETLSHVFEPFFTTKPEGAGNGLGLSMVYGFTRQTGGHVRIYSEIGRGTTVKLYLPRSRSEGFRNPAPIDAESRPLVGSETILAVEDNDLVRKHVTTALSNLGYKVLSAGDGHEALTLLQQEEGVDLLFTDVVMPGGLSGRELAERAWQLHPGLPVLFTSGYTENSIIHNGRLDPGVHLLQKPYRHEELAAKIRKVLAAADASRLFATPREPGSE